MKTRLLFAASLLCIGIANAAIRRCYKCASSSSWDNCTESQVVEDCLSDEEQCAQFLAQAYIPVFGSSKTSYLKGCAPKRVCQRTQISKVCDEFHRRYSGARISCQVFCSSGNCSNGGKPPDRTFASSSPAKSAGEIVGGVVGSVILLVLAYVVVQKRRRRGNTNVFTDMLDLAYKLRKEERELEEQEQEESSTVTQFPFSI